MYYTPIIDYPPALACQTIAWFLYGGKNSRHLGGYFIYGAIYGRNKGRKKTKRNN
jgi:hypothetical protein